jgi:hypothetical protein
LVTFRVSEGRGHHAIVAGPAPLGSGTSVAPSYGGLASAWRDRARLEQRLVGPRR